MKKTQFDKALREADKGESIMNHWCEAISGMFQPYFKYDISVMHRVGDGFVVIYDEDNEDVPVNIEVQEVFDQITKDPEYYT